MFSAYRGASVGEPSLQRGLLSDRIWSILPQMMQSNLERRAGRGGATVLDGQRRAHRRSGGAGLRLVALARRGCGSILPRGRSGMEWAVDGLNPLAQHGVSAAGRSPLLAAQTQGLQSLRVYGM